MRQSAYSHWLRKIRLVLIFKVWENIITNYTIVKRRKVKINPKNNLPNNKSQVLAVVRPDKLSLQILDFLSDFPMLR